MFGLPESGLADTLRDAEEGIEGYAELEITTCLRRGEIEMVTRFEPGGGGGLRATSWRSCASGTGARSSREDGSSIDDQVLHLLVGRRVATAESCTAGLLAARLTERPGSSEYVMGGVVAYSNEAKVELLGVDPALIEEHGAVSEPVAEAMAEGALRRFEADTAVAITGHRGARGRDRGEAGRDRVLERPDERRPRDHPHDPPAGRPSRHPRPLDDRGDAPAAPRAVRGRAGSRAATAQQQT